MLDVVGVGYRASVPAGTMNDLPSVGEECVLHTRMVVREDAMLLFGFATRDERAVFDALTAVSKVGPKLAISVLSTLSAAGDLRGRRPRRRYKVGLRTGSR